MACVTSNIHLQPDDQIAAACGTSHFWIDLGDAASLFASPSELIRLRAAIDDSLAMQAERAVAA